jgi:hypothetical protein
MSTDLVTAMSHKNTSNDTSSMCHSDVLSWILQQVIWPTHASSDGLLLSEFSEGNAQKMYPSEVEETR